MPLQDTNLILQIAQLPTTFRGTPQQFLAALVARAKIVSPSGTNFIFIGDTEPTSNVGPWLKDGTQWFVFDENLKRYIPLDISASETRWYSIGNSVPTTTTPPVWLKTTKDVSDVDPSVGDPIGWYVWDGSFWIPFTGILRSGTTAQRPGSPVEFETYYDTTISCQIWWERGMWRTVSGVPGDIKQVAFEILTDALTHSPGWDLFGASNQDFRGRFLVQATRDPGLSPETDLTTSPGVPHRSAFETAGETDGVKMDVASTVSYPPSISLWTLVRT